MARYLHIDASPRAARSRSRNVTATFLAALREQHPDMEISTLNLWQHRLPDLAEGMIEGRYDLIMGQDVPPEIAKAWDEISAVCTEFLAYDGYIFSVPMWNFGIPYRLKHYIDVITQPRMLFTNNAQGHVHGMAAGKRAVIIAASALPIGIDGAMAELDFQLSYLQKWLGFIGITDMHSLRVAPTFGDPASVEAVMEKARAEAIALAQKIS